MKHKKFNVGDKVFAKVKGYPAWPAIITHENKSTYSVLFYGTGEVAACKPQDLYYYLKHRQKFTKNQKRKEYIDAVEEIDFAIVQAGGEDGNTEEVADTSTNSCFDTEDDDNKNNSAELKLLKRKYKAAETKSRKSIQKKSCNVKLEIKTETEPDIKPNVKLEIMPNIKSDDVKRNSKPNIKLDAIPVVEIRPNDSLTADWKIGICGKDSDKNSTSDTYSGKVTPEVECSTDVSVPETQPVVKTGKRLTIYDITVITDKYLTTVLDYAEHVRKNPEIYKRLPMETRSTYKNELFLVKMKCGEYIGIKYNRGEETASASEYERALYDETEATTMFSMKKMLQHGHMEPEEDLNLFETNLDITEEEIKESVEYALIENKKRKLDWLRVENRLAELDTEIKKHLGLDQANPAVAENLLGEILKLEINVLMLFKHPAVMVMAKRLCKYVGNVGVWKFTESESENFAKLAERVREKANAVFNKFLGMLDYTGDGDPWNYYLEQLECFDQQTYDLSECRVFSLTAPPRSRATFFNNIEDEVELKEMANKLAQNKDIAIVHIKS